MYEIRTKHGSNVTAERFNTGSDGFVAAKNGSTTVASIPVGNVVGIFRRGDVA